MMEIEFLNADAALAPMFYQYRQDPVTKQFNPLIPATIESLEERLRSSSSDWGDLDQGVDHFWFLQINSDVVGTATVQNINTMMKTAEIGYGVFAEARGKGFATCAVIALARKLFEKTSLRKLTAYVHEENLSSRKVLEKAGFKSEGLLREHYLIDDSPVNEVIYGLLRREVI